MKTKLFFATDIHGSEKCFRKFVNAGKFYGVDVMILGGDITGKMLIPIVKQSNNTYRSEFLGNDFIVKNKEEYDSLVAKIRMNGMYPYETDEDEMVKLQNDDKLVEDLFTKLMIEGIERWFALAEERLKDTNIKMYVTGGNDDRLEVDRILKSKSKKSENFFDPDGETVKIDDYHEMINNSYSNPTPWNSPRELNEKQLEDKIEKMVSTIEDIPNSIFNLHVPPINSGLDTCPKLDTSVYPPKPIMDKGAPVEFGAGSEAVKNAIDKYQPLLGLHGHIHESRGVRKIGRTLCVNPGSEYSEGILRGIIVTLDEKKIKGYQLTSG